MSNPLKSSNSASPFIKREQLRRDFLKSRLRKNATPKPYVKKEDPDAYDERTNQLLNGGGGSSSSAHPGIKQEKANPAQYNEFPLRAVSHEHLENIRTHILKFQSKKKIEPAKDLHLPVRLHRKDTRNLQFQLTRAEIVQRQKEIAEYKRKAEAERSTGSSGPSGTGTTTPAATDWGVGTPAPPVSAASPTSTPADTPAQTPVKTEGQEHAAPEDVNGASNEQASGKKPSVPPVTRLEEAGAAEDPTKVGRVKYDGKETPIEADGKEDPFADVAPDGGGRFKRGNVKRKTRSLKLLDENAKRLRFEEFYPWVLEDFDGLNTWVGSYEAGNSDSYVLLSVENDGSFTMIPADKVYKFTARNKYATLTIDEAEKRMEKNGKGIPRWLMKHLDDIGTTTTRYDRTQRRLRAVDARQGGEDDRGDNSEVELDFDEEFADDEEAPIIDGDEKENKESELRIKREMLQANAMGLRDEEDAEEDLFGEKKIDDEGERTMKALQKSDMAALYESDDESKINPYLSESEAENAEEDKEKGEDEENGKSSRKSSPRKKSPRGALSGPRIHVKSIKNFQVILKADKSVLKNFPEGAWNPHAKTTGANVAENEAFSQNVKVEEESTENPDLLTEGDIINVVAGRRMNLKQLIKELKEKVARHPSNKDRMKHLVKKLVKLKDGYLELTAAVNGGSN
ncbi:LAME_0C03290g1_1 [Lachancea meyersii CBS 8951]|uniref:Transcription initiation factor IIF subunit alpha n=1 Tax=Lachancea meyersii CBS 8951 TaxID=1266667 RepID=A0A1G4J088_9SACH|nr:LAME_0C03290g1_1 [Lachancea meyersii CBS 8951]